MAGHDYSVAANEVGVYGIALVPGEVATVTLLGDAADVEVLSMDGASEVYFTSDGSTPVVEGRSSRMLPAAVTAAHINPWNSHPVIVRLVSAGAPRVAVTRR